MAVVRLRQGEGLRPDPDRVRSVAEGAPLDRRPETMLAHDRRVEEVGRGGTGVVWRAVDTTLGREVAIKVLPVDVSLADATPITLVTGWAEESRRGVE